MRSLPSFWFALFAVAAVAQPVSARVLDGTETAPELTDPANDVHYDPRYVSGAPRPHLDVLSAWILFEETADAFVTTIKMADLSEVERSTASYLYDLRLDADAFVGDVQEGRFGFSVTKSSDGNEFKMNAVFVYTQRSVATPLAVETSASFGNPGYFVFELDRAEMQSRAERLEGFRVLSAEYYFPVAEVYPVYANYDEGQSGTEFALQEYEPRSVAPEDEASKFVAASSTPEEPASPFLGFAALVVAVSVAAGAVRRFHRA